MFSNVPCTSTTGNGWAALGRQFPLAPSGLASGATRDAASASGKDEASPGGAMRMARGNGLTDAAAGSDAVTMAATVAAATVATAARRGKRFMGPLWVLRGRGGPERTRSLLPVSKHAVHDEVHTCGAISIPEPGERAFSTSISAG